MQDGAQIHRVFYDLWVVQQIQSYLNACIPYQFTGYLNYSDSGFSMIWLIMCLARRKSYFDIMVRVVKRKLDL